MSQQYDIRAELPDRVLDFHVYGEDWDQARARAERRLAAEVFFQPLHVEWRGQVAFVNRPVPLEPRGGITRA